MQEMHLIIKGVGFSGGMWRTIKDLRDLVELTLYQVSCQSAPRNYIIWIHPFYVTL